jgi:hypothetical protein
MDILSNNKPPRLCKPRVSDGSHEGLYSVGVLCTVLVSSVQCWCPHVCTGFVSCVQCWCPQHSVGVLIPETALLFEWILHDSTLITFTAFPLRLNIRYMSQ